LPLCFASSASPWRYSLKEKTQSKLNNPVAPAAAQDAPGTQKPEVVALIGPVHLADVRSLPYIAPEPELETEAMMRYPHGHGEPGAQPGKGVSGLTYVQRLLKISGVRPHNAGSDPDV
jgi:hypothetical protein